MESFLLSTGIVVVTLVYSVAAAIFAVLGVLTLVSGQMFSGFAHAQG